MSIWTRIKSIFSGSTVAAVETAAKTKAKQLIDDHKADVVAAIKSALASKGVTLDDSVLEFAVDAGVAGLEAKLDS